VGAYYQQTLRTPDGRALNEGRVKVNTDQEPGTYAPEHHEPASSSRSSQDETRKG
jgi:NADH-quinone oxidoreductase subunit C